ncbi:MAG: hypothetical protein N4J56_004181 [Chroococcidiopsis sp. SAG 2025]|nr:hypothetical protein [Chroococcidiopsis sp. SAG 2025]
MRFSYQYARLTKTAYDVYTERAGVCRDFMHLAVTFCRCLHIPARCAAGYLGDIDVPPYPLPMDFSTRFEYTLTIAGMRSMLVIISPDSGVF